MKRNIPRIVIAATQSGSGKTTIVTGILGALKDKGIKAQSYKIGPDYIDPGYHKTASGRNCCNLDSWLTPQDKLANVFASAGEDADIAIIEGVMGLYDGGKNGISSTASIAKLLNAPVLLVINAKSMGESAAALALGFKEYDKDVNFAGVIVNRLGSSTHKEMICEAMEKIGVPVFGNIMRNDNMALSERHLGLLPTTENDEEKSVVAEIVKNVSAQVELEKIIELAKSAEPLEINELPSDTSAAKTKIGVAFDEAFSFYYEDSLKTLERFGAQIIRFSPLHDAKIPEVDGLIFGGGFPEMFAEKLSANKTMISSIVEVANKNMPIYAECGGYMYLTQKLIDFEANEHPMVGILPGAVKMGDKLKTVGYVEAEILTDNILGKKGTVLKGHEFHFSYETDDTEDGKNRAFRFKRTRAPKPYDGGAVKGNIVGSYLHLHFLGAQEAAKNFIAACTAWHK